MHQFGGRLEQRRTGRLLPRCILWWFTMFNESCDEFILEQLLGNLEHNAVRRLLERIKFIVCDSTPAEPGEPHRMRWCFPRCI